MIGTEEIRTILSSRVDIPETFVIGSIIRKPDNAGCVVIKGGWYTYTVDARGGCIFSGPYGDKAIIFACAKEMHAAKLFDDYKFSEEERKIYRHVHLLYDEI